MFGIIYAEVDVDHLGVGLRFERFAIEHLIATPITVSLDCTDRIEASNNPNTNRYCPAPESAARQWRFAARFAPELCYSSADQPAKPHRRQIQVAFGKDLGGHPAGIEHGRECCRHPKKRKRERPCHAP